MDHLIDLVHRFTLALFVGWTAFSSCVLEILAQEKTRASCMGSVHVTTHLEMGAIFEAVLLLDLLSPLGRAQII